MKRESRAPLIVAIVLLVLPVLYVGSYLALVVPPGTLQLVRYPDALPRDVSQDTGLEVTDYRIHSHWCVLLFWPLEQIDRKLRPGAWDYQHGQAPTIRFTDVSLNSAFPG